MDKVSVIMPCYNDGKYINESINSVLQQDYENIEIIIVDDGSDDEYTIKILKGISDERIKLYRINNSGPAYARNFGIEHSSGEFILPLDADDLIDKTYLRKAIDIIKNDSEIGVVYCKADLFGEKTGLWDLPSYSFEKMLLDNIVFVTALFRKKDWQEVGGFNTKLIYGMEDYDFWISLLENGKKIHQIQEILFHYRIKTKSRTKKFSSNIVNVKNTYEQIYLNHEKFYLKHSREYSKVLRNALIEQIFINSEIKEKNYLLKKISENYFLKKFLKKYILK